MLLDKFSQWRNICHYTLSAPSLGTPSRGDHQIIQQHEGQGQGGASLLSLLLSIIVVIVVPY